MDGCSISVETPPVAVSDVFVSYVMNEKERQSCSWGNYLSFNCKWFNIIWFCCLICKMLSGCHPKTQWKVIFALISFKAALLLCQNSYVINNKNCRNQDSIIIFLCGMSLKESLIFEHEHEHFCRQNFKGLKFKLYTYFKTALSAFRKEIH